MNMFLVFLKSEIYDRNGFTISNFAVEPESQEYGACRFEINGKKVISRNAKITPRKVGQFVTCWKRSVEGTTQPFDESDDFDLLVINVSKDDRYGQFVFPKSILAQKGIVTTIKNPGKRGFRVYPAWDRPTNKQAIQSQKWQLNFCIGSEDSLEVISRAYLFI